MKALRNSRWLLVLLVVAGQGRAGANEIMPYDAVYELSKGLLRLGTLERRLEVDSAGEYRFESRMKTQGLATLLGADQVIETSRGRVEGMRFLPERYDYARTGGNRDYSLHFDYDAGIVRRSDQASGWTADMPLNVLDKLVYQAQLMLDLDAAPESLNYDIADKGKLKKYVIKNLGHEKIETTVGRFDTVKLERSKADSKRRTTVWCAVELGWIPVKVEHRDKQGGLTTALLRSLDQR